MRLSEDVWDKVWEQLHKLETAIVEAQDAFPGPHFPTDDEYVKKSVKKKKKR